MKELSDDEKSLVVGEENGRLKFKEGIEIAQCPICCERLLKEGHSQEEIDSLGLADIPDSWTKCGVCGTSFEWFDWLIFFKERRTTSCRIAYFQWVLWK